MRAHAVVSFGGWLPGADVVFRARGVGGQGTGAVRLGTARRGTNTEAGFVATELILGIGLLILPVALLVLTLPGWSERQTTARVIARETARTLARDGRCDRDAARSRGDDECESRARAR